MYADWKRANGPLDAKPLDSWVLEFELLTNHLITPLPLEDMDWEQVFFYQSLLYWRQEYERKANEDAVKKAKQEAAAKRR
jgi:hypothetical protein